MPYTDRHGKMLAIASGDRARVGSCLSWSHAPRDHSTPPNTWPAPTNDADSRSSPTEREPALYFTKLPGRGAGASSSAGVRSSMHSHQSAIPAGLSTFSYTHLGRDESHTAACLSGRTCCTWSWSYEEVCVSRPAGRPRMHCRHAERTASTLRAPIYLAAASGRPETKGLAMPVGCRLLVAAASLGHSPKLSRRE